MMSQGLKRTADPTKLELYFKKKYRCNICNWYQNKRNRPQD
jgi:hypothetical protein